MPVTDVTAKDQTAAIAFEIELAHPPEKVWRALTDPALLSQWLLPAIGFDLDPGTLFRFETQPQPGWDGVVHCQVLDAEPPRMLRYKWTVPFLDTEVTFRLEPTTSGTRLSLVQSGFKPDQKQNFGGARYGWRMMGSRLIELLDTMQ
jgi:uncharacterized protein YndB with AHSA1/START domain